MIAVVRRARAHSALWTVVGLLGLATVFASAGLPRLRNDIEDTALRQLMAQAPSTTRDLTMNLNRNELAPSPDGVPPAEELLGNAERALLPELSDAVGAQWAWARTAALVLDGPGVTTEPVGLTPRVTITRHTGVAEAVTLTGGRPPLSSLALPDQPPVVEVIVSEAVATALGLKTGGTYGFHDGFLPIRVTGVYTANDPASPLWLTEPTALEPGIVDDARNPILSASPQIRRTGTLFTDTKGMQILKDNEASLGITYAARFRLDEAKLDAGKAPTIRTTIGEQRVSRTMRGFRLDTRLDALLDDFLHQASALRAVFAVVEAGALGATLGLLTLAARLAVDRRRTELRLVRARGGSTLRVAVRLAAEALLVVVPAAVVGWALHYLVPGRAPDGWPVTTLVLAAAAILAIPVAAVFAHRRVALETRQDMAVARPGLVRLTAEATVVGLAVLGAVLLQRRGLSTGDVDPYLSAVPLLLGVAAGVVALRAYPWPVRVLGRAARTRRGAIGFLGLARAGRVASAAALPLVVLVLAIATGSFAGSVRAGVDRARDVAAAREVGGDFKVAATAFTPKAMDTMAAVPGVRRVAPIYHAPLDTMSILSNRRPEISVIAVDAGAYRQALAEAGIASPLPADLVAEDGDGPLPAFVSTTLAPRLPESSSVAIAGRERRIRALAVGDDLPGIRRTANEFVVVPWTPQTPVNELLVVGNAADPDRVRAAGASASADGEVTVVSLAERRSALQRHAFNGGLTAAFLVGTLAALLAALLAVALSLVVDAPSRGRALSLLRTMGLSVRQARTLLLIELLPLVALALVVGAAVGIALPVLLAAALGLDSFTGGVPVGWGFDGGTAALLTGVCALLAVVGILTESAVNRRLGLGRVLRV